MTLAEFWPLCLCRLHEMLPAGQFAQWIAPLTVGEENGVWVVYGKNQFACNMLKSQFAAKIDAVRAELVWTLMKRLALLRLAKLARCCSQIKVSSLRV